MYYNVCIPSPDAVMDLTLRSNGSNSSQHFALFCITGERNADGLELSIRKDNSIMRMTKETLFTVQKLHSREVLASGFRGMGHKGIFYCHLKQGSKYQSTVTLISNYNKGKCLLPLQVDKYFLETLQEKRIYLVILFMFFKVTSDHRGSPL